MPPRAGASPLHVDDTLAGHGQTHAQLDRFILMHAAIVSPRCSQFHLVTRKRSHYYMISLYRTNTFDDFSPRERPLLKERSHVLFPIVESHVAALDSAPSAARATAAAPLATQSSRERVARQFANRLRQSDVKLSTREIEACTALLAGDTVPAIAVRFALRESTVETYLRRAAAKLRFGGRHGLTHWMLDETAGSATEAGGDGTRRVRRNCASLRIRTRRLVARTCALDGVARVTYGAPGTSAHATLTQATRETTWDGCRRPQSQVARRQSGP